jgi:hypothetical protein
MCPLAAAAASRPLLRCLGLPVDARGRAAGTVRPAMRPPCAADETNIAVRSPPGGGTLLLSAMTRRERGTRRAQSSAWRCSVEPVDAARIGRRARDVPVSHVNMAFVPEKNPFSCTKTATN